MLGFTVTSIRAFFMGADNWKKETKMKEVNATTVHCLDLLEELTTGYLLSEIRNIDEM